MRVSVSIAAGVVLTLALLLAACGGRHVPHAHSDRCADDCATEAPTEAPTQAPTEAALRPRLRPHRSPN